MLRNVRSGEPSPYPAIAAAMQGRGGRTNGLKACSGKDAE
jgi:hypothetical protein